MAEMVEMSANTEVDRPSSASEDGDVELEMELPDDVSFMNAEDLTELCIDVCETQDAAYLKEKICPHSAFEVDAADENGYTPLQYAVTFGSFECFKVLVDAKANPAAKASDGSTCLHIAAQYGFEQFVQPLLAANVALEEEMPSGSRALGIALLNKHAAFVKQLVLHKCDLNYRRADSCKVAKSQIPLQIAAGLKNIELFTILLEGGANPLIEIEDQPTTLMQDLVRRKQFDFLDAVENSYNSLGGGEQKGLVWNEMTSGYPVFFDSLYEDDIDVLEYLVARKADLAQCDQAGSPALFVAAFESNFEAVEFILSQSWAKREGDSTVLTSYGNFEMADGFCIVHLAVENNNLELLKTLCVFSEVTLREAELADEVLPIDFDKRIAATQAAPIHFAAQKSDPTYCEMMLEIGVDFHCTLNGGFTPLHLACQDGLAETAKTLLEFGADPLYFSDEKFTPMQLAFQCGDQDTLDYMFAGVDSELKNPNEDYDDSMDRALRLRPSLVIAIQSHMYTNFATLLQVCEDFMDLRDLALLARVLMSYLEKSDDIESLREDKDLFSKFKALLSQIEGANADLLAQLELDAVLRIQRGLRKSPLYGEYLLERQAAIRLQRVARGFKARQRVREMIDESQHAQKQDINTGHTKSEREKELARSNTARLQAEAMEKLRQEREDALKAVEAEKAAARAAEEERIAAEKDRLEAEALRQEAEKLRQEAQQKRAEAEAERAKAEAQRAHAESERRRAEEEKIRAEEERKREEEARLEAIRSRIAAATDRLRKVIVESEAAVPLEMAAIRATILESITPEEAIDITGLVARYQSAKDRLGDVVASINRADAKTDDALRAQYDHAKNLVRDVDAALIQAERIAAELREQRSAAAIKIQATVARGTTGRQIARRKSRAREQKIIEEAAATRIQSVARMGRDQKVAQVKLDQKKRAVEHAAATRAQSVVRMASSKREVQLRRQQKQEREMQRVSAIRAQSVVRMASAKRVAQIRRDQKQREREEKAAIKIQSVKRMQDGQRKSLQKLEELCEREAAIQIQAVQRMRKARQKLRALVQMHFAATRIQSIIRMKFSREEVEAEREIREYLEMVKRQNHAAMHIQSALRIHVARKKLETLRVSEAAAKAMQSLVRMHQSMRKVRRIHHDRAATVVQTMIRRHLAKGKIEQAIQQLPPKMLIQFRLRRVAREAHRARQEMLRRKAERERWANIIDDKNYLRDSEKTKKKPLKRISSLIMYPQNARKPKKKAATTPDPNAKSNAKPNKAAETPTKKKAVAYNTRKAARVRASSPRRDERNHTAAPGADSPGEGAGARVQQRQRQRRGSRGPNSKSSRPVSSATSPVRPKTVGPGKRRMRSKHVKLRAKQTSSSRRRKPTSTPRQRKPHIRQQAKSSKIIETELGTPSNRPPQYLVYDSDRKYSVKTKDDLAAFPVAYLQKAVEATLSNNQRKPTPRSKLPALKKSPKKKKKKLSSTATIYKADLPAPLPRVRTKRYAKPRKSKHRKHRKNHASQRNALSSQVVPSYPPHGLSRSERREAKRQTKKFRAELETSSIDFRSAMTTQQILTYRSIFDAIPSTGDQAIVAEVQQYLVELLGLENSREAERQLILANSRSADGSENETTRRLLRIFNEERAKMREQISQLVARARSKLHSLDSSRTAAARQFVSARPVSPTTLRRQFPKLPKLRLDSVRRDSEPNSDLNDDFFEAHPLYKEMYAKYGSTKPAIDSDSDCDESVSARNSERSNQASQRQDTPSAKPPPLQRDTADESSVETDRSATTGGDTNAATGDAHTSGVADAVPQSEWPTQWKEEVGQYLFAPGNKAALTKERAMRVDAAPALVCRMYERPSAGVASSAWKFRGPQAERDANLKSSAVEETSSAPPFAGCRFYENLASGAGTASAAWQYRGPVAEAKARRTAAKVMSSSSPEAAETSGDGAPSFEGVGCRLYERSTAGIASAPWKYRGPAAERLAEEARASATVGAPTFTTLTVCRFYEKGDAGDPSSASFYRGPEAERSRLDAVRMERARAPPPEQQNGAASARGWGCNMFEHPEAGTPSATWFFRGPEAEKAAITAQRSANGNQLQRCNFYEKITAGIASTNWRYRGPAAERAASRRIIK